MNGVPIDGKSQPWLRAVALGRRDAHNGCGSLGRPFGPVAAFGWGRTMGVVQALTRGDALLFEPSRIVTDDGDEV